MTEAVNRLHFNAEARVRSQGSPVHTELLVKDGTGTGFPSSTAIFTRQYQSIIFPRHY